VTYSSIVKRSQLFPMMYGCLLGVMILLLAGCGRSSDKTYTLSGQITFAGSALADVTVTLTGDISMSARTDANGNYAFSNVPGGTFAVTPTLAGFLFRPLSRTAWLSGIDGTGFDFVVHDLGRLATATHTVYVKDNGSVWAWGNNSDGQLGDGSLTSRSTPVQITALLNIRSAAVGSAHSMALKNDGSVWAWGNNSNGQLGDGGSTARNTPQQVLGLSGMIAVAAGSAHSVALKNDGTVWAWGRNNYGQVGDGTPTERHAPVQVGGLSGVTAVAAGSGHTVALKNDGTVWAWGNNSNGQLGDGGAALISTIPVQVKGLSGMAVGFVTAVSAGYDHTVALKNDGTVWAWGNNSNGQLGIGSITSSSMPVQASGLAGMTAVAAGFGHTLALKSDGSLWTWGNNSKGQLGNGLTNGIVIDSPTPVGISGLVGITDIAGGYEGSVAVKGVLKGDGTVWAWGSNNYGQLGNGLALDSSSPVQVLLP